MAQSLDTHVRVVMHVKTWYSYVYLLVDPPKHPFFTKGFWVPGRDPTVTATLQGRRQDEARRPAPGVLVAAGDRNHRRGPLLLQRLGG